MPGRVSREGDGGAGAPVSVSGLGSGPEFDRIRRFLAGARGGGPAVRVGPGDDCAVVTGAGIALSADMSVEGVHFRRDWLAPEEIGWRATSAALSDLAAVAARPVGVLCSLAVSDADAGEMAERVMVGVREAAEAAGGALLGGDLTRSPGPLVLDVTVVGESAAPVLRTGARPGHELWVTGELGAPGFAVAALLAGRQPEPAVRDRFARPVPRLAEALWLVERAPLGALIDLSDGLGGDAGHVATASGVALELERAAIPIHPAVLTGAATREEALAHAMSGGEDYELCLTAPGGALEPLRAAFEREHGVRLTRVGRVAEGSGLFWMDGGTRAPLGAGGYQHFRGDP
jgi:thiamine-monophosphate kinase